ncbi:putative Cw7 protein [Zostera marina]|uniref:Putative Cw7 protein n=1 Tax=Zostera marina TaxID=29655 RepID=A0A0K9NIW3_ZOSMR|nr:putative Cw7 protein [Zostera marina]
MPDGMAEEIPIEISDYGKMPSRFELLSIVRKHSDFLKQGMVDELDESDLEMDHKFWNEMLDLYFISTAINSKGNQEDDLVFFVKNTTLHGYAFNDDIQEDSPYFVRRWAPKLENVVGQSALEVDWRRSFYLNLIAHTSFTVTIAICSAQSLDEHQHGKDTSLSPLYKVVKTVFASPNRVNFQLNSMKAVESVSAYPSICFAIDDFDDTFDAVVLSEIDHCYCVLLNAHNGAAFPKSVSANSDEEGTISSQGNNVPIRDTFSKLTLFSGFVSYPMVREAYDAGKSRFGSLLSMGNTPKTDKLFMKGPGGRGEVEVAVSGVADQSQVNSGHHSPVDVPKTERGIGLGTIFRKAKSAASEVAKQAYAAAYNTSGKENLEALPLKCCLMSITLPWEYLAHDLLFKATPPVNI